MALCVVCNECLFVMNAGPVFVLPDVSLGYSIRDNSLQTHTVMPRDASLAVKTHVTGSVTASPASTQDTEINALFIATLATSDRSCVLIIDPERGKHQCNGNASTTP